MKTKLEVCIDSEEGIKACLFGKADRIELCSSLNFGGLSPSFNLMKLAANISIPTRVMIRPRSGDFYFSPGEMSQMLINIDYARSIGLEGVVLGITLQNGEIDQEALKTLSERSIGMGKTLHRVVDSIINPIHAVDIAINLGFDCILSSGGAKTAIEGLKVLKEMHNRAAGRIEVMPGSGVTSKNVGKISSSFKPNWLHSSCSSKYQNELELDKLGSQEDIKRFTDSKKIINLRNEINY